MTSTLFKHVDKEFSWKFHHYEFTLDPRRLFSYKNVTMEYNMEGIDIKEPLGKTWPQSYP